MKYNRWNWGLVPVVLVLALIWYEFWTTGAFAPMRPAAPDTTATATQATASTATPSPEPPAPAPRASATTPQPLPLTAMPPGIVTVETTARRVPPPPPSLLLDDAFLNNPPPISLDVTNVPLTGVVDALRTAFNMPAYLQVDPNTLNAGGNTPLVSLQAKNVSFWDVIQKLQTQTPLGFLGAANLGGKDGIGGLTLSTRVAPVYHFQSSGPAILYPISINYRRSVSIQPDPADRPPPAYVVLFGAAVDPRLPVARAGPLEIHEDITDDQGHPLAIPDTIASGGMTNANFWTVSANLPVPPANSAHKVTLHCQLHFFVQLPAGVVALDDAGGKVGAEITLGERKFHLADFRIGAGRLDIQVTPDDGVQSALGATLIDSAGHAFSVSVPTNPSQSFPAAVSPPFRLVLRDLTVVREVTVPFEFKDLPLP